MLGLVRIHHSRMSGIRNTVESLYGCAGMIPPYNYIHIYLKWDEEMVLHGFMQQG
jgi:hypothetical protein